MELKGFYPEKGFEETARWCLYTFMGFCFKTHLFCFTWIWFWSVLEKRYIYTHVCVCVCVCLSLFIICIFIVYQMLSYCDDNHYENKGKLLFHITFVTILSRMQTNPELTIDINCIESEADTHGLNKIQCHFQTFCHHFVFCALLIPQIQNPVVHCSASHTDEICLEGTWQIAILPHIFHWNTLADQQLCPEAPVPSERLRPTR